MGTMGVICKMDLGPDIARLCVRFFLILLRLYYRDETSLKCMNVFSYDHSKQMIFM